MNTPGAAPKAHQQDDREFEGKDWTYDKTGYAGTYGRQQQLAGLHAKETLARAETGDTSVAQQQMRQGLAQARQSMANQAAARGSNPLAQRAAIYGGAQMSQDAVTQSAALRAQEMQAAQAAMAQYHQQAAQGHMGFNQMDQQRQLHNADLALQHKQMAMDYDARERKFAVDTAMGVASLAAGAAMSDERAKQGIGQTPGQTEDDAIRSLAMQLDTSPEAGAAQAESLRRGREAQLAAQLDPIEEPAAAVSPYQHLQGQRGAMGVYAGETTDGRHVFLSGGDDGTARLAALADRAQLERAASAPQRVDPSLSAPTRAPDRDGARLGYMEDSGQGSIQQLASIASAAGAMSDVRSKQPLYSDERVKVLTDELARRDAAMRERLAATRTPAVVVAEPVAAAPRRDADAEARRLAAEFAGHDEKMRRALDQTARGAHGYGYEYRPEARDRLGLPGGARYGIMAQDLERTPIGRTMVRDTPAGKVIDRDAALTGSLGLIGRLGERVDQLEAELSATRGGR